MTPSQLVSDEETLKKLKVFFNEVNTALNKHREEIRAKESEQSRESRNSSIGNMGIFSGSRRDNSSSTYSFAIGTGDDGARLNI